MAAQIPLYQPSQLPPSSVGQVKPSLALADQSGKQQVGQVISGIGNEVWSNLLTAKVNNEKATFLGAEKTARANLNQYITDNPFASEGDIRDAQGRMIAEIEDAGQKSRLPDVKNYAKNWMAQNKEALFVNSGNDITQIIKQREQANFNIQMENYENRDDQAAIEEGLQFIENQRNVLIDPKNVDIMKKAFEQKMTAKFEALALDTAMGEAFDVWQGTVTEEKPNGDLKAAYDFVQSDKRISNEDKATVESKLKSRINNRRAEEQLELEAQRSEHLDKINKLIYTDHDYNAAVVAIEASSLSEQDQGSLLASVDRRAAATANGKALSNNREEEARLYNLALNIGKGEVTKKSFDDDMTKNGGKLDGTAYRRVTGAATTTQKSSQKSMLSRADMEAGKSIVNFREPDVARQFVADVMAGLSPDAALLFQDNFNEDRKLQFDYLAQYNQELKQWGDDNPDKTGKEFYQYADQLKHLYWNTSTEELRARKVERDRQSAGLQPLLTGDDVPEEYRKLGATSYRPSTQEDYDRIVGKKKPGKKKAGETFKRPEDKQAYDWAKQNMSDPRAKLILKKLGVE